MKSMRKQIGGMYNTMFLLVCIGAAALLIMTVAPVYMNEAKVAKIVAQVSAQPGSAKASSAELHRALQRRWDIDDVKHLDTKDVQVKKSKEGKTLDYQYEVRKNLFSNWDLVLTFENSFALSG